MTNNIEYDTGMCVITFIDGLDISVAGGLTIVAHKNLVLKYFINNIVSGFRDTNFRGIIFYADYINRKRFDKLISEDVEVYSLDDIAKMNIKPIDFRTHGYDVFIPHEEIKNRLISTYEQLSLY